MILQVAAHPHIPPHIPQAALYNHGETEGTAGNAMSHQISPSHTDLISFKQLAERDN